MNEDLIETERNSLVDAVLFTIMLIFLSISFLFLSGMLMA